MLLSIEPTGYDNSVQAFRIRNGYHFAGIDALFSTGPPTGVRAGFSFFTGIAANLTPPQIGTAQRRAFVILNGVPGSPSHDPWEILHRSSSFTQAADTVKLRNLIDSIEPGAVNPTVDYETWIAQFDLPSESAGSNQDPDGDGAPSGVEFHLSLDPTIADFHDGFAIERTQDGSFLLRYREARNRAGSLLIIQTATSPSIWDPFEPPPESIVREELDGFDLVTIDLKQTGLDPLALFRGAAVAEPAEPLTPEAR